MSSKKNYSKKTVLSDIKKVLLVDEECNPSGTQIS